MTARLSPISRRFRRYKLQQAASAAVADALKRAPAIFGPAKQRKIIVLARRMGNCAATTTIRLNTLPGDATRIIYRNPRQCRSGLCMSCARMRARKANQRIGERLDAILTDNPGTRFAFVTLTSRNRPIADASAMLASQEQGLGRFWRSRDIARAMTGHVTGMEIALRRTSGQWEAGVHSHSLVTLDPDYFSRERNLYLSQRALVALWRRAMRVDYNPICHIAAVAPGDGVHATLRECIKYAVAPHKLFSRGTAFEVDPLVAAYLADALYKRRMTRFGGSFSKPRRNRTART